MTQLVNVLEQQCERMQALQLMLDSELHLISTREPEALMKLVHDKEQLLEQIQQADTALGQLYQQQPEEADTEQVKALAQQLKTALQECQYRTEINQKAVEQGQLRIEHLRNLLLESRAKESMTYNSSGKTHSGKSGKGISA